MNWSINTASESSNSVQWHLNIISDCVNQISQAMTLTWEAIREYASKVVSNFWWSGWHGDFLMVDRVVWLIKKLRHHLRDIQKDLAQWWAHTQEYGLVATMNEHMATLQSAQRKNNFLHMTFGWALEEPMRLMQDINSAYKVA